MADSRDITGKNRKFTGTDSVQLPQGSTAQRNASGSDDKGKLRYNSTTNLAEYYNGTDWKPIDSPPTITTIALDGGGTTTAVTVDNEAGGDASLVINGSLFDTTAGTVVFEATSGSDVSMQSTTRTSVNQFTVTFTRTDLTTAGSPYALKVTNGSGLAATLAAAVLADESAPVFAQSAGSLGSVFDGVALSGSGFDGTATDADGDTITYSVTVGSLPAGLSISSSTGYITGTPTATGTETFTVQASAGGSTSTREFSITVVALPSGGTVTTSGDDRIHTFNSSSSFVNTKVNLQADVLVVAGGGSGGAGTGGGGGAGGLIYISPYTFLEAATYTATIGAGGTNDNNLSGNAGVNSTLSGGSSPGTTLTANGGGYGASTEGSPNPYTNASSGGSGGGGTNYAAAPASGAAATQPANTNDGVTIYNTTGFGNSGPGASGSAGSGGGGAGGAGAGGATGTGGSGKQYDISGSNSYYAAGGSGGENGTSSTNGIGGYHSAPNGTNGAVNTGSGGGGGWSHSTGVGGNGGSGIIIVRYDPTA